MANYMLYTKNIKIKKDGKETSFPKYLTKVNGKHTLETQFSNDCLKELKKQMAKSDYDFPINIEVNHHFIKKEKFTTSKGEQASKNILVILECKVLGQAQFESVTIEDVIKELEEKEHKSSVVSELPF